MYYVPILMQTAEPCVMVYLCVDSVVHLVVCLFPLKLGQVGVALPTAAASCLCGFLLSSPSWVGFAVLVFCSCICLYHCLWWLG